jgi:hypothetical protein
VGQRTALVEGRSPHVLHLTAPFLNPRPHRVRRPEVSELTPPPANRKPVITAWVSEDRSSRPTSVSGVISTTVGRHTWSAR